MLWNYIVIGICVAVLTLLFLLMAGVLPVDYTRTFGSCDEDE